MANWRPEIVEDQDPLPAGETIEHGVALAGLMLALKALSQRAIVALEACFTLVTVVAVWFLWWSIPDPNANQIVSLSIFALFVLLANVIVLFRRRK